METNEKINEQQIDDKKEIKQSNKFKEVMKKVLNFIVVSMNGMAYGLFATLIIGTIIIYLRKYQVLIL